MPTEGVYVSPEGKKTFIPLENNPDVFTSLIHDLGVSDELGFYDVYSLDEKEMISLVPRPAVALIFITPAPMYYAVRGADGTPLVENGLTYDKSGEEEPIIWFLQTIGHTCGLIALLHSIANGEAKEFVTKGSTVDDLITKGTPLKPLPRADVLYNSDALEEAHMKAARGGDSLAPGADEPCGLHFIAFVRGKDNHLWELEGASDGPIDRGLLEDGEDMLSDAALERGVKRFLSFANGNIEFSVVALAKKPA